MFDIRTNVGMMPSNDLICGRTTTQSGHQSGASLFTFTMVHQYPLRKIQGPLDILQVSLVLFESPHAHTFGITVRC